MAKTNNKEQHKASSSKAKKKEILTPGQSLLTIGKGLLSNQACLDSRHAPFYFHIIVCLLSLVITWIPFLSLGYTKDNAGIFTSASNAEIDKGFKAMMQKEYFQTKITINGSNTELVYDLDDYSNYDADAETDALTQEYTGSNEKELAKATFVDNSTGVVDSGITNPGKVYTDTTYVTKATNRQFSFYYDVLHMETSNVITDTVTSTDSSTTLPESNGFTTYLQAYFIPSLSYHDEDYSQALVNFQASVIFGMDSTGTATKYPHSYVVFTKDAVHVSVYALKAYYTNSLLGSFTGYVDNGLAVQKDLVNSGSLTFYGYLSDNGSKTINETYTAFHDLMNDGIRDLAIQQVWINILIVSGVYAGTVLIAAVILLIMHKRKASIARDVNFFDTLKEAITFGLTASLISLLGFMQTTYSFVALVGVLLIRIVWSMSRLVPPQDTSGQNKPLYQARS